MPTFDRINAAQIESAANTISGLDLSGMGKDGHGVANLLWALAAYLKTRNQ
jgi:hypothetical protein